MYPYMRYINRIARCSTQYRGEMLKDSGIKGCHFVYILYICSKPGLSQDELSKMIYINKSNVARQLMVLEEGGFISRAVREENKRVTEVFPTIKALELLPQIRQVMKDWNDYLFAEFSEEEKELFARLIKIAAERASAKVDADCPSLEG